MKKVCFNFSLSKKYKERWITNSKEETIMNKNRAISKRERRIKKCILNKLIFWLKSSSQMRV